MHVWPGEFAHRIDRAFEINEHQVAGTGYTVADFPTHMPSGY